MLSVLNVSPPEGACDSGFPGALHTTCNPDPDADLVQALKQCDSAAFGNLVKRHERRLLNVAQRMMRNREDAEDVVQESFLKVHMHFGSFRGDCQLYTWLTRITVNQALMKMRRKKQTLVSIDDHGEDGSGSSISELSATGFTPEESCAQAELENILFDSIANVRKSARKAFQLHVTEEIPLAQIATMLGASKSSIKSSIYRARQDLRNRTTKHFPRGHSIRAVRNSARIAQDGSRQISTSLEAESRL